MPFQRSSMRYGHSQGYTHCTYTQDGDKFLTCGADGDLRIWNGVDDDDPMTQCIGEFTIGCIQYAERILVTTDVNTVQTFTYPDCDRDGTEFRCTGTINCIRANSNFIAVGTEDMEIRVSHADKSEETFELLGHSGPILSIDLSPQDYLASSSGDGSMKIWDLKTKKVIHSFTGFETTKSFSTARTFSTPSFEPESGKYLAYTKSREIIIADTTDWNTAFVLTDKNVSSDYVTCQFSCCGKYIAAGTMLGEMSIWNVQTQNTLSGDTKGIENHQISSISWNPLNNGEIVFCDMTGQLGLIDNILKVVKDGPSSSSVKSKIQDEMDIYGVDFNFADNFDKEDEDNDNCVSLEKLKSETMRMSDKDTVDDNDSNTSFSLHDRVESRVSEVYTKKYKQQEPFQPSSTSENLEHRYLLWNDIGIVCSHRTDDENSIDVEFHDASLHHGMHMNNSHNHTMASLSSTVLVLSGKTPSKVVCIALSGAGSREWSVEMPDCEEVVSIAASDTLVAVGTDTRLLRIYGVMGTQREVVSIPGPIVSLSGHKDKLFVIYHSHAANEEQFMTGILIQTNGFSLRSKEITIPLTSQSKLSWCGFSDNGSPVTFDSIGILRMFCIKTNMWYPILNSNLHVKGESDGFFIVGVSEINQIVQAILCRGSNYPLTNPRPMVSELKMMLPLCEMETEKSQMEESLVRCSNFTVENSSKEIKETSIKLFAIACRGEMEARAKELIEMLASPDLIPLAMKYASKLGRIHLAEKLGELLPTFDENKDQAEQNINIEDTIFDIQQERLEDNVTILQKNEQQNRIKITPKPMTMSHQKRNPFKKLTSTTSSSSKANPLRHLFENVVGLSNSSEPQAMEGVNPINDSEDLFDSSENTENIDINKSPTPIKVTNSNKKISFNEWFKDNKIELELENPAATPQEITKLGVRKYKTEVVNISASTQEAEKITSGKRKLDDTAKESGISKLAKFGFSKC